MISRARQAAFAALRTIAAGEADLGDALRRTRDPLEDPRDRALSTELVLGTLRTRAALDYQLQRFSARPLSRLDRPVLDALRLAAYQIVHLTRQPVSAVVNDAVSMVKSAKLRSAAPFANAVLRQLARERDQLVWPSRPTTSGGENDLPALAEFLSITYSHPLWLVNRWLARYGETAAEDWLRFNSRPPPLMVATNRLLTSRDQLAARLAAEDVLTAPTTFASHGLTVVSGAVLSTRTFREGYCLIQDEASQLIAELVDAGGASAVLDVCASPGGKTIALAAQIGTEGHLVAADVRSRRVRLLAETVRRCQAHSVRVVHTPVAGPLPFAAGAFDRVLVDAPCSGLGTVRRDPDIRWRRTEADLLGFGREQRELLHRVEPTVAIGGRVVYSTCSSEPEENEDVVTAFLAERRDFRLLPISTIGSLTERVRELSTPTGFFRSAPTVGLEAFFAAVLERRTET